MLRRSQAAATYQESVLQGSSRDHLTLGHTSLSQPDSAALCDPVCWPGLEWRVSTCWVSSQLTLLTAPVPANMVDTTHHC